MPNTIAQNLTRLYDAKLAIAEAIESKGGEVQESDGFEAFPQLIEDLSAGEGSVDYSLEDGFTSISSPSTFSTGKTFDWTKPYEIQVCVVRLADSLPEVMCFGPASRHWDTPKLAITNSYISFVPNSGTSSDIDTIYKTYDSSPAIKNKPLWVRCIYDGGAVGTGIIKIMISYNGRSFEEIASKIITAAMRNPDNIFTFGSINNGSGVSPYLDFIWNQCYIKINGEYEWGKDPGTSQLSPADYNLSGTLTPNNYGAYIFPQNYDWSKPWEIGLVLQKVASSMNSGGFICGSGNMSHGYGCPKFNINDESIGLYAPYSTSLDKDGLGIYFDTPLEQGKAYWIRGGYEGSTTNKIYIEMSEDGQTYTRLGEKTITFTPIYNSSLSFSLGGIYDFSSSLITPKANIPLNTVYIKIDGEIVWGKQN